MDLSIVNAIELAISNELEARSNYLSMAEETDDPELKNILKRIAQEEAEHEASLRTRLNLYKQRQQLHDTLSRYVSPEVCKEILKNPKLLQLGGQMRHITVLFADIRGFTSLAEKLTPKEVVQVLNTFFTQMVDLVFEHKGTIDKFMGDALMAIFGAPLKLTDASRRAVVCALAMQRRLQILHSNGTIPIQGMRIGINTGKVIVGNIGSAKRMDFTVVGDVVNIASRLLDLCRELEAEIIIGESTFREVEGQFDITPGPDVVLRGRQESTVSYRVSLPENH